MEIKYSELQALVDKHLLDFIPKVNPLSQTLYDSMEYSLTGGGKRLRPVLLLAACQFAGGDVMRALPYACAIEYIHTYSLIHDDLPAMDNDDLRRGQPTNHVKFGADIATLAGDGLLNTAFELMYKDMFLYFDQPEKLKRRVNAAYRIAMGAGVQGMVAGQTADVESDHNMNASQEMLQHIQLNKTAAMIIGAVTAGLELSGADAKTIDLFSDYAECLGLEFQVVDDILDVIGTAEQLGKQPHQDEANGTLTSVSLMGLDGARKRAAQLKDSGLKYLEPLDDSADFFRELIIKLEKRTS